MHKEILTREQVCLLPLIKTFSKNFGLVGGTAVAFYLGHRQSLDFDLFTNKEFENLEIRRKILKFGKIERVLRDEEGQYTVVVDGVRITFFYYPFRINFPKNFNKVIKFSVCNLDFSSRHMYSRVPDSCPGLVFLFSFRIMY